VLLYGKETQSKLAISLRTAPGEPGTLTRAAMVGPYRNTWARNHVLPRLFDLAARSP
jgi:hypothetical protein